MAKIREHIDPASALVIAVTLVLFVAAVFIKGLGHDLLLEAGVFLVSVKLILMAYKSSVTARHLNDELAGIRSALARLESGTAAGLHAPAPRGGDPRGGEAGA
jgi:hypothetical protein